MAKYPDSVHKADRQSPANNNAVAAGPVRRAPVPPLVPSGAFGTRKANVENLRYGKGGRTYDGQNMNHRKLNNADPFPKNIVPVKSALKVGPNGRVGGKA